jgi:BolA protein
MRKMDRIREQLEIALAPQHLKILDESAHHAGHVGVGPGGETHFRIEITCHQFVGLSQVERHRMVYKALNNAFAEGLHALEIYTKAPGE